jgi:hypothetical protein
VVLVRILTSKSGFEDEVLIKLIVGVVKHVTINELGPVENSYCYKKLFSIYKVWL